MKLRREEQMRDVIRAYGLRDEEINFNEFNYREGPIAWDRQDIAVAVDTPTNFFDTSTSTRTGHTNKQAGCNLTDRASLPIGTTGIVSKISIRFPEVETNAKIQSINRVVNSGVVDGIYLNRNLVFPELPLEAFVREQGVAPITAGEGTAAAVIYGARGIGFGFRLTPESMVSIDGGQNFYVPVRHFSTTAPNAAVSTHLELWGLLIEQAIRR